MSNTSDYHQQNLCFNHNSNLEKISRVFNFNCKSLKILDLGCGDGRLSGELVKKGHQVWGLDCSDEGLKIAESRKIKIIKADLEEDNWTIEKNSFDIVLLLDVLEHLYDQEKILKKVFNLLKPTGQLIVAYPNHFDLRNRLNILFGGGIVHWDHKRYDNTLAQQYGHIRFLRLKELVILLQRARFYLKSSQFNFMAGGIVPTSLTPRKIRVFLLKCLPNLFSGKFVLVLSKVKIMHPDRFFVSKTKKGM